MRKYAAAAFFILIAASFGIGYLVHYRYIHRFDPLIDRASSEYGLDPALVRALIHEESGFDPKARSTAGALGLMQVSPIIVREWTRVTGEEFLSEAFPEAVENIPKTTLLKMKNEDLLHHPEINLQIGCWYLDQLLKRYSDWEDPLPIALASYNAGPSNGLRWNRGSDGASNMTTIQYIERIDFPETKRYVKSVLERYKGEAYLTTERVQRTNDK